MRRIYESAALARDDEEPFTPAENDSQTKPQSFRSVSSAAWSNRLLPAFVRYRAVSITVSTPKTEFEPGVPVPFRVTIDNRYPVPVSIPTDSPLLWTWTVDGHEHASRVDEPEPPERPGRLSLDRGETKRIDRRWFQKFRVSERSWEQAAVGEHTIGVSINTNGATLADETTVRITPRAE